MARSQENLVIENWQQGIAPSPDLGFGMMRNVDITTNPGSVRLNSLPVKVSGSTVTGIIIGFRRNPINPLEIWAYDVNAVVYKSGDSGGTWSVIAGNSSGTGAGIAIWKDYLFVATFTKLDVYGPLSGAPAWSLNWQTLTSDTWHTMLESVDDKLYICNKNKVSQLKELTTFLPGTGSTYTFTAAAITLAAYYRTKCLADLGQFLMVGTWVGNLNTDFKIADIFPYTRADLTLGVPLKLAVNGVHAMLSFNNRLYIIAGVRGELFVSDSTSFTSIAQIPNYVVNYDAGWNTITYPGAMVHHKGKILFGLSGSNGTSGNLGVYSLTPDVQQNVLTLENIISTGGDGTSGSLFIGALLSTFSDIYIIGWQDVSTTGIDKIDNTLRVTSYGGYIESPLYPVGESLQNKTFGQGEVVLRKPLVSGQGVRIKYRKNLTEAFTTLTTLDFATYSGSSNLLAINFSAASVTNAVFLQVRIELTTGAVNTSPEVMRVTFRPSQ